MTFLCKRVKTGVSDHYYFLSPLFPRQWSQDSDPESSIWQSWPSTICGNGGDRKLVFDFGFTSFRWNSPFSLICGYKNRTWMTLYQGGDFTKTSSSSWWHHVHIFQQPLHEQLSCTYLFNSILMNKHHYHRFGDLVHEGFMSSIMNYNVPRKHRF